MKIKILLIIFILFTSSFFLSGCTSSDSSYSPSNKKAIYASNYVIVKYRADSVDIANPRWEKLNTTGSSVVNGAWYDDQNKYMIINLNGTNYHYCGLSLSIWSSFKVAPSFGSYYNSSIKGKYDCRVNPIPDY